MPPRRAALTLGAAVAFVNGWLLPVAGGRPGWQAFRVALSPLWPYEGTRFDPLFRAWHDVALIVASGLTNVVFVLALFDILVTRRVGDRALATVLLAAAVVDLHWLVRAGAQAGQLQVGYYVWIAAFVLLAIAASMRR